MSRFLVVAAVAILALAGAATAAADEPTKQTSTLSQSFVDNETCPFPTNVTVDRVRTTITFSNGDQTRHVDLTVTISTNDRTWIERDSYIVFISADSPNLWEIVGSFTHTRVQGGGTVFLESGRISYDLATDTITDLHPGPHGTGSDPDAYAATVCAALAPKETAT